MFDSILKTSIEFSDADEDNRISAFYSTKNDINTTRTLLFNYNSSESLKNVITVDTTIDYLIKARQYDESLFNSH